MLLSIITVETPLLRNASSTTAVYLFVYRFSCVAFSPPFFPLVLLRIALFPRGLFDSGSCMLCLPLVCLLHAVALVFGVFRDQHDWRCPALPTRSALLVLQNS